MYFLIGADGREYGPFTADQIRDWIAQGRANTQSRIRRDGDTTWQPLGEVAEFADPTGAATSTAGMPPPTLTPESIAADYLARKGSLDIGSCLSRGWTLVRDNPGLTIGSSLLAFLVVVGIAMVPFVNFAAIFINPIVLGGVFHAFVRRMRGEMPTVGDAFSGFGPPFLHLGLAGLVATIFICVGLLLCVVPGIYLGVAYTFALPLVIDKKLDFWTAMEVSRRVINRHWWPMFGLLILLFILNVIGVLACFVGWIVTVPVSIAAVMYAYEDLLPGTQKGLLVAPVSPTPDI
jgi:hypothetical protein